MIQYNSLFSIVGILYTALVGITVFDSSIERVSDKTEIMRPLVKIDHVDTTTSTTTTTLPYVKTPKKLLDQISPGADKRCPQWEQKFIEHSLPVELFSYIAYRESRCNSKSHNTTLNKDGSRDLGLLQINSSWRTVTKNICGTDINGLFDIDCNLSVAKYLYNNGGAGHWSLK
jgi:hypothetical protein